MTASGQSPVFVRVGELIVWLANATRRFPRDQRFVFAQRVMDQAFGLEDALVAASVDRAHVTEHLVEADMRLAGLRRSLLHCHALGYFSDGQLRHVTTLTAEVGRLLGGWRKAVAG